MKPFYLPLLLVFVLVGCGPDAPIPTVTYMQGNSVAGTALEIDNTENVRYSETLKGYPIGRYVDPNNPDVMHEAHTIYRAETQTAWNLDPNMPTAVPMGPAIAVTMPDMQQVPLTAELEQKIQEQNKLLRLTAAQNEKMLKNLEVIAAQRAQAQQSSKEVEARQNEWQEKQELMDRMKRQANVVDPQNRASNPTNSTGPSTYQKLQNVGKGTTNSSLIENLKKQFLKN